MATEKKVITTPYDEEIARLDAINLQQFLDACREDSNLLIKLKAKREGWLVGYQAGIKEVRENPDLSGLAAPTKGDR